MDINMTTMSLLQTKLYMPNPGSKLILREELLNQLNAELNLGSQLTLVTAPAGYGKTTLIVQWLQQLAHPIAWVSLDAADSDSVRFFSYLIAALQKVVPAFGQALQNLLQAPQVPGPTVLMTRLINELVSLDEKMVLVLDDYHLIRGTMIQEAVQFLLDHHPEQLHLVLITRMDPPFTLGRLRTSRKLTEIRLEDLRFDLSGVDQFLTQTVGQSLAPEVIAALEKRTEGWVAGLQLAALSLQGLEEKEIIPFVHNFSGSHRYIIEYLLEEVLGQLSQETRKFLEKTSILQRLHPDLCDALLEWTKSREVLQELREANLFLIPLDKTGEWYRYHHLFADFLRTELSPVEKTTLHQHAAHWYQGAGLWEEAVNHAFQSEKIEEQVQVVSQAAEELLTRGDVSTIYDWLQKLPQQVVTTHSHLNILKGWALLIKGQVGEAARIVQQVVEVSPTVRHERGRLLCLQSYLASNQQQSNALDLARQSLEFLEERDSLARTFALISYGQELFFHGQTEKAIETFSEAYHFAGKKGLIYPRILAANYLASNLLNLGRLREVIAFGNDLLQEFTDSYGHPLPLAKLIFITLGRAYFLLYDLEKAQQFVEEGMELVRDLGMTHLVINAEQILVEINVAAGENKQALESIARLKRIAEQIKLPMLTHRVRLLEKQVKLILKDHGAAQGAITEYAPMINEFSQTQNPSGMTRAATLYVLRLLAKAYLIEEEIEKGVEILQLLQSEIEKQHQLSHLIWVYVLQTKANLLKKDRQAALTTLTKGIQMARLEECRLPFIEEADSIKGLLAQVRKEAPEFIDSLLEIMGEEETQDQTSPNKGQAQLIEPLSERELEILQLICEGLSNKGIAEKLFITIGTVKWHVSNIYGKLGVKRRTQAVQLAQELELI